MNTLCFLICTQQLTKSIAVDKTMEAVAFTASAKLYGHPPEEKPWRQSSKTNPLSITNGVCDVYFSKKIPGRISTIFDVRRRGKVTSRPQQGEKFKTLSEWEEFGFQQVHKIWDDVDGFLTSTKKTGELVQTVGGRQIWSGNSNMMSLTWFSRPVNGMLRQFDCEMDLATGRVFYLACSGFFKQPKHVRTILDNSKKRKTKVALPPN